MAFRLFYFNPLFDFELSDLPHEKVAAPTRRMSPLFALMGDADDRVLLDAEPRQDYWDYLDENRIGHCLPVREKEELSHYRALPWGWNRQAVDRLNGLGVQCDHPDLAIVKAVNSRAWCAALNSKTKTGVAGTMFCTSIQEVQEACMALNHCFPLVIKPEFGASGYGFIKIVNRESLSGAVMKRIKRYCAAGGCLVEPWLARTADLSSSCVINRDGSIRDRTHYECRVTSHGAFYGVYAGRERPLIDRYRARLERAVNTAAAMLAEAGYFGPAGFDSFVCRDRVSGKETLVPIVEINARQVMSALARVLHEKTGRSGCAYVKLVRRKRMTLPARYDELYNLLGKDRYDTRHGRGILLVSPLRITSRGSELLSARNVFYLSAESTREAERMDARIERVFSRNPAMPA